MTPIDSIDFTRGNIGLWVLFVCAAGLVLAGSARAPGYFKNGWKQAVRLLLSRAFIGVAMAAPVVLVLAIWQRVPPQYFVGMRMVGTNLVLSFRWPKPDLIIPLKNVWEVRVTRTRSLAGKCFRVRVRTETQTFTSLGYARLEEEEYRALEKMQGLTTRMPEKAVLPKLYSPK